MPRRKFICGNWKMHKTPAEAEVLADAIVRGLGGQTAVDVAIAPTHLALGAVAAKVRETGLHLAAQNLHPEVQGAFTGEVSGEMLRSLGVAWCIVGHSERRQFFGDTDDFVAAKVRACLRSGLLPILCVGETLTERDAGHAEAVVERQLTAALAGLEPDQLPSITLAYEPVWAIGTGRNATPEQAQAIHAFIRGWLTARYPAFVPENVRIQYGGSVKAANAASLLSQPDVDGALVGGAALVAEEFVGIVRAAG